MHHSTFCHSASLQFPSLFSHICSFDSIFHCLAGIYNYLLTREERYKHICSHEPFFSLNFLMFSSLWSLLHSYFLFKHLILCPFVVGLPIPHGLSHMVLSDKFNKAQTPRSLMEQKLESVRYGYKDLSFVNLRLFLWNYELHEICKAVNLLIIWQDGRCSTNRNFIL